MDCGPTCLRMIAQFYGKTYSLKVLREYSGLTRGGVSLAGISLAAEKIGFRTLGVEIPIKKLVQESPLPVIAYWSQTHFIVLYKIRKGIFYVADPAHGLIKYNEKEFAEGWYSRIRDGERTGIALLLEPTIRFFDRKEEGASDKKGFLFLSRYLKPYRRLMWQLVISLLFGSLLQLLFPLLTQSIVDIGINNRDVGFIHLILLAQLMLFFSQRTVEFIRSWILLHISARVNINLISDFLIKLMKLPIAYFDTKQIGDIMQRIKDHTRIEQFLTTNSLSVLFSFFNLVIFGIVLAYYNSTIFLIFLFGSILYTLWIVLFLKRRRELDFKRFSGFRENTDVLFQLITGMQEIKLHNCEEQKRWNWERIQARLFKLQVHGLKLNQWQQAGALGINELKNILISFFSAKSVIEGDLTLGMMLSVQYIIGQLNGPIQQMISFIHYAQDAKISLERLNEIHSIEDETHGDNEKINELPKNKDIVLKDISYYYDGTINDNVLNGINLIIPEGKVTAIVGTSGSGKTTLLKLLLQFYKPRNGEIKIGDSPLHNIHSKLWRREVGVVMQDGFIFNDTILKNIVVTEDQIDKEKLKKAVQTANIEKFILGLPIGINTKIGSNGQGLSTGQKQRILIARAVYKDPSFIFFDEATNSLDSNNEKAIMKNLNDFFNGRTVVIVAHRLSTVKSADQILVLEKGRIVEIGNHQVLSLRRGKYYELVKNQLELEH